MKRFEELIVELSPLSEEDLHRWIDDAWVRPTLDSNTYFFSDVDVARVRMICDIHYSYSVEEETMPLILSLIDQLYATRRSVRQLTDAVAEQPADVREAIFKLISKTDPS